MISILIPLYNYKIASLVYSLHDQIKSNAMDAEIIIVDDASTVVYSENIQLQNLSLVSYLNFSENRGRSYSRNYLASKANYNYLLFIDCDAEVINDNFLMIYQNQIGEKTEVICGGVEYQKTRPKDQELYLRWLYGTKRESRSLYKRNEKPYNSFSSFNFLIKKDLFQKQNFNENIREYGHEDTLFGINLLQNRIRIDHIHNPLVHSGLETNTVFIEKTERSLKNLKFIYATYNNKELLERSIKLLKYVRIIKNIHIKWLVNLFFLLFDNSLKNNLKSSKPSLFYFDLYKICYYFSS